MKIVLQKVSLAEKNTLYRLLQYSLYEESISDGNEPDSQALFDYPWFDLYFTDMDREALFIRDRKTETLLGFVMINTYMQKSQNGHSIAEFMVLPKYRRTGIGTEAAMACFRKHQGNWEVSPVFGSETAYEFWKHVISQYTDDHYQVQDGLFCFTTNDRSVTYSLSETENISSESNKIKETNSVYDTTVNGKVQGKYTRQDYDALPAETRKELIDGVFYDMASPSTVHQRLSGEILFQITAYIKKHKGSCIPMAAPVDVCLDQDDRTMVQPDILILCDQEKCCPWGINGAPDFVLEILSPSTRRKDAIIKLHKYADAGVKEYWMVDPKKKLLITYDFRENDLFHVRKLEGKAGLAIYKGALEIDLDELARIIEDGTS